MVKEKRKVSNFNKIQLSGYGTLKITQCELDSLAIETNDKNLPFIETKVENKVLKLKVKNSKLLGINRFPKGPLIYTVTAKNIRAINITGSADVIGTNIDTQELNIAIAGSGNFKMSGNATIQDISSSGSANLDCTDLKGLSGNIIASGSGKFKVNVSDSLSVKVSGSSDVFYKGNPRIERRVSGSARISQL